MRIYLAGPMRDIPYFNFPLFKATRELLRSAGHEVFCPAENDMKRHGGIDLSLDNPTGDNSKLVTTHKFDLRQALSEDCEYICKHADAIALLPGWEASNGARAEHALGLAINTPDRPMKFIYITTNGNGEPILPAQLLNIKCKLLVFDQHI